MEKSKLFGLNTKDIVKGFLMAFIGAFVGAALDILTQLQSGEPIVMLTALKTAGITAGIAGLSYLLKNFFTGETDKILTNK